MPILIDELELMLTSGDGPDGEAATGADASPGPGATLTSLEADETRMVSILDLIRERRLRLMVD